MAVITPSSLISEIRGSVGDVTYSKNRSGPVVKQKLIQPPSNTPDQAAVRADLAAAVAAWQALSQEQQNKWMNFTEKQSVIKSLGRRMHRTGYNEFISRWQNRIAIGGSSTSFNPLPVVRLNPIITAVNQGTTSITIDYDTLRPVGNCRLAVYATPPISAGINQVNPNFYRIIGSFEPTQQVDTHELYTMYTNKFPLTTPDIGKKIGFAIRAINTDNYAAGGFFFVQIIISGGLVDFAFQVQLYNADYYQSNFANFMKTSRAIPSNINRTRGKLWKFYNY
jgi:hypothetical protein